MCELRLHFSRSRTSLRLYKIESQFGDISRCSVVSEVGATRDSIGRFRWSRGVRALSILALRAVLARHDPTIEPRLYGGRGSIAASLDGVLSKEPAWLLDTFGLFPNGTPVHRRLFARSNPGQKRVGPVAVSLARRVDAADIGIFLDGEVCSDPSSLRLMMRDLERSEVIVADSCTES